jgi:hypothetical protein
MDEGRVSTDHASNNGGKSVDKRLSAAGWGLFFVWVGVVLLLNLNPAFGALGVGVITLGVQGARKSFGLAFEGFWVVIGILFAMGGLWAMYEINIPVVPILLMLAGVILLVSVLRRKK